MRGEREIGDDEVNSVAFTSRKLRSEYHPAAATTAPMQKGGMQCQRRGNDLRYWWCW
jgi:hypothetical protein